jgi:alpha-L-fucosidase
MVLCFLYAGLFTGCANGKQHRDPDALREDYLKLQYGMFLHFNMSTFVGYSWSNGYEDPLLFAPDKLDCNQWADVAVKAGMKYGILTVKHTGGWCLWDSKYTNHDMELFTNYKDGNGDIVREFVDAFRKRGLKVCLYYCLPGDFASGKNSRPQPKGTKNLRGLPPEAEGDHLGFMKKQMTELLTNYGKITALFLDSSFELRGKGQYDELRDHIIALQPNCLVVANGIKDPGKTEVASYERPWESRFTGKPLMPPVGNTFPAEVNDLLSENLWFWEEPLPGKTPGWRSYNSTAEAIVDQLEHCIRNNANYVLNVEPNKEGLIIAKYVERLEEVARIMKERDANQEES